MAGAPRERTRFDASAVSLLFAELGGTPSPDRDGQRALAARVAAGEPGAVRDMVQANLRLVFHWARRFENAGVELADLIEEGVFGLWRAVEKFDATRGYEFSTYASFWVRQAQQRAVRRRDLIKLPVDVAESLHRLRQTRFDLVDNSRRVPTAAELAELAGMAPGAVAALAAVPKVVASVDQLLPGGEHMTVGDAVADGDAGFEDVAVDRMMWARCRHAVRRLDPEARRVVELRFGFGGDPPLSKQQVAERLGIAPKAVSRIEAAALAALAEMPELVEAHQAA